MTATDAAGRVASAAHRRRRWAGTGAAAAVARVVLATAMAAPPRPLAAAEVVATLPPAGVRIDGDPGEWLERPPHLAIAAPPSAGRPLRVWFAESADGLIIAGQAGGPPPGFAATPGDLPRADHLFLWIALADDVPLPKIGWSNPVGAVELESADDCARLEDFAGEPLAVAGCKAWHGEQVAYRRAFRRLFARAWRMAPGIAVETLATPAFASLDPARREALQPLAPKGRPVAGFAPVAGNGYGFEVVVPWDALPPAASLDIARLRVGIEAVTPAPASAATAAAPWSAEAGHVVRLDPPRRWRIGRCAYPLEAADAWEQQRLPAYFLPTAGSEVDWVFVVENPPIDARTDLEAASPVVSVVRFFGREIAPAVVVCGPPLAVRRGAEQSFEKTTTLRPGFRVQAVADGWLLADGPYLGVPRHIGGDCGGCPAVSLQVLFLPKAVAPAVIAFAESWPLDDDGGEGGDAVQGRVSIDAAMTTIHVWEAERSEGATVTPVWTRIRYCYDGVSHLFAECGRTPGSPPPADLPRPPAEPTL